MSSLPESFARAFGGNCTATAINDSEARPGGDHETGTVINGETK